MKKDSIKQSPEHGGAGVKLLLALTVLILIANAGYNYVPVAYQGENIKQEMHTAVVQGSFVPNQNISPVDAVRDKLGIVMRANKLPPDSYVEVKENNKVVRARIYYEKEVELLPFGAYKHVYVFDHTATPEGFTGD